MKESVGKMVERPDNAIRMIRESIESSMFDGHYGSEWSEYEDGLLTYIASLEAENATLKEAQRWIPVSERLPDDGAEVLICFDRRVYKTTYEAHTSYLDDSDNSIACRGFRLDEYDYLFAEGRDFPTHWISLPELPEVTE